MALKNGDKFTIYDAMEASGAFASNPANINARGEDGRSLYAGPIKFPMMLYHPQGEEVVVVPGTSERTGYGTVEKFGEQTALVSREVRSEEELAEALAEGWHKHPAVAIKAANATWRAGKPVPVPPISAGSLISDLEERNRKLTELLDEARKSQEAVATTAAPFVAAKGQSAAAKAGLV